MMLPGFFIATTEATVRQVGARVKGYDPRANRSDEFALEDPDQPAIGLTPRRPWAISGLSERPTRLVSFIDYRPSRNGTAPPWRDAPPTSGGETNRPIPRGPTYSVRSPPCRWMPRQRADPRPPLRPSRPTRSGSSTRSEMPTSGPPIPREASIGWAVTSGPNRPRPSFGQGREPQRDGA